MSFHAIRLGGEGGKQDGKVDTLPARLWRNPLNRRRGQRLQGRRDGALPTLLYGRMLGAGQYCKGWCRFGIVTTFRQPQSTPQHKQSQRVGGTYMGVPYHP